MEVYQTTPDLPFNDTNASDWSNGSEEYIFNRREVRIGLITAYTLVFCCCFFGNLMIISVIILHRSMRSTTHFFMANLAVADICVGIFCVYQNLSHYLASEWAFGEFLCKMYHFVHGLSYTASILILTLISLERYVVIVHPFWTRRFVTMPRLRLIAIVVWLLSAVYNSPRLIVYGTIFVPSTDENDVNGVDTLCVLLRAQYNSREYDLFNFIILFALPICLMCVLYFFIVRRLWASGENVRRPTNRSSFFGVSWLTERPGYSFPPHLTVTPTDSEVSQSLSESGSVMTNGSTSCHKCRPHPCTNLHHQQTQRLYSRERQEAASRRIVMVRKRVIRLLLAVVVSFLVCNLPFHARKFWQYWSSEYNGASPRSHFLTIATTLVLYMNSGINPFLYATLSGTFQRAIRDVVTCRRNQWQRRYQTTMSTASHHSSLNRQTSL